MLWCICADQRMTFVSSCFPFTKGVLGLKLTLSDLANKHSYVLNHLGSPNQHFLLIYLLSCLSSMCTHGYLFAGLWFILLFYGCEVSLTPPWVKSMGLFANLQTKASYYLICKNILPFISYLKFLSGATFSVHSNEMYAKVLIVLFTVKIMT